MFCCLLCRIIFNLFVLIKLFFANEVFFTEKISSRENRLIKDYVKLSSSKSRRDKAGLFVIEGIKLLEEAVKSGVKTERVFVTDEAYEKYALSSEKFFQFDNIYLITPEISEKMTSQETPQGVYAVCRKLDKHIDTDKIYSKSGKYVMLCGLQNAGNVGTIMRTAEAMGIDGIFLAQNCCEIYNPKVLRGSMGSVFRVPSFVVDDVAAFLQELKSNGFASYASVLSDKAKSLSEVDFSEKSVLLIGNEGNGLDNEVIEGCTDKITIEMNGVTESLNASVAACIMMWEMTKLKGK